MTQLHDQHIKVCKLLGTAYGLLAIIAGSRKKGIPEQTWDAIARFLDAHDEWRKESLNAP